MYSGVKDGKPTRDVVTVTHRTTTIDGAPCVVVVGPALRRREAPERTTDWYTQDRSGNVWYFGEDTAELDRTAASRAPRAPGRPATTARPGIFMPAHPRVGQTGRQEYYKGHAEDHFRVAAVIRSVLRTPHLGADEESTPLEPGVIDHKLYVRGVGTVLELTVKGGTSGTARSR